MDKDVRWISGSDPADENTFPDKMSKILLTAQWSYRSAQRACGVKSPEDLSPELTQKIIQLATEGSSVDDIIDYVRRLGREEGGVFE